MGLTASKGEGGGDFRELFLSLLKSIRVVSLFRTESSRKLDRRMSGIQELTLPQLTWEHDSPDTNLLQLSNRASPPHQRLASR
jgi:hypothetical protein